MHSHARTHTHTHGHTHTHTHTHTVSPTTPTLQGVATVVSPEPITTVQETGGTGHVPQPGNLATVFSVCVLL